MSDSFNTSNKGPKRDHSEKDDYLIMFPSSKNYSSYESYNSEHLEDPLEELLRDIDEIEPCDQQLENELDHTPDNKNLSKQELLETLNFNIQKTEYLLNEIDFYLRNK